MLRGAAFVVVAVAISAAFVSPPTGAGRANDPRKKDPVVIPERGAVATRIAKVPHEVTCVDRK
jgi:hypothetical protein